MIVIGLGCANEKIHEFRTDMLGNFLRTLDYPKRIDLICSGWTPEGNNISEARKMKNSLEEKWIFDENPRIVTHLEEQSNTTFGNIHYSFELIHTKNLDTADWWVKILTSDFHKRVPRFVDYILQHQYPESYFWYDVISAEDYASTTEYFERIAEKSWQELDKKFRDGEWNGMQAPIENYLERK